MALKERKARIQKWEAAGDVVYGRLLKINKVEYEGQKPNAEYIVREKAGEIVIFQGTKIINSLLFQQDIGKIIQVAYQGEDPNVTTAPRPKLFEIQVDDGSNKKPEANAAGLEITDDDIPF